MVVAGDLEEELESENIIDREPSDSVETVTEADKFSWDQILNDEDDNREIVE